MPKNLADLFNQMPDHPIFWESDLSNEELMKPKEMANKYKIDNQYIDLETFDVLSLDSEDQIPPNLEWNEGVDDTWKWSNLHIDRKDPVNNWPPNINPDVYQDTRRRA